VAVSQLKLNLNPNPSGEAGAAARPVHCERVISRLPRIQFATKTRDYGFY